MIMLYQLCDILSQQATLQPDHTALSLKDEHVSYRQCYDNVVNIAAQLQAVGLQPYERVAIYLPKQFETVYSIFAISLAGGVFVPINPALKAKQVSHIIEDCEISMLITSPDRLKQLDESLCEQESLRDVVITGDLDALSISCSTISLHSMNEMLMQQEAIESIKSQNKTDQDLKTFLSLPSL